MTKRAKYVRHAKHSSRAELMAKNLRRRSAPETPALRVVQTSESPEWWKVLDADGEQHGAAKRTQEEAEALLEDLTGA